MEVRACRRTRTAATKDDGLVWLGLARSGEDSHQRPTRVRWGRLARRDRRREFHRRRRCPKWSILAEDPPDPAAPRQMAWTNNLPVEAATLTQLFPSSCCIQPRVPLRVKLSFALSVLAGYLVAADKTDFFHADLTPRTLQWKNHAGKNARSLLSYQ